MTQISNSVYSAVCNTVKLLESSLSPVHSHTHPPFDTCCPSLSLSPLLSHSLFLLNTRKHTVGVAVC